MSCPVLKENPEMLLDYCARKLHPGAVEVLRKHIEVCEECHRFAVPQEQLWSALDSWEAEPVSADFDDCLYARISAEPNRSLAHRMASVFAGCAWWKPALPIAATAVAAVVMFHTGDWSAGTADIRENPRAEYQIDVYEVERAAEDLEMLRQFSSPARSPSQTL